MTGARTVLTLVVSACILITGTLLFGFGLGLTNLLGILLVLLIGSVCFTAVGFLAANLSRDESNVNMISNLISFPMLFTSEAFYSLQHAPEWVRVFGQLQPFHYFVRAMNTAVTRPGVFSTDLWTALAALTGFAVLFLATATFTFRWDSERTSRRSLTYRAKRHSSM
ncbi:ABC-2 family transporter [Fontibacillus phaseoli]|uniref:ABC-2 family transporter n=1 Tax=Fontibacillus phaseoli TaxID=1416533 RepID=A0A369B7Y6_9BACL|nr:ABC transporter permease [Fontibacillus phaseoli]RCX16708.1 ABC-2 family transporter [Fontibacillus phaseoli]